jgi:hypothetical protein
LATRLYSRSLDGLSVRSVGFDLDLDLDLDLELGLDSARRCMLRITPPARHEHSIFESRRLEHVNPIGPLRLGAGKVHPISFAAEPKPRDIASTPRSLRRRSPHLRSIQLGED